MGYLSFKKYLENSNPNAKIGFVIFYPFQFYVYKNIYKHLKDESEFIVDLGAFFPMSQPQNLLETITNLLEKYGVFFRILYYEDYFSEAYLKIFFSKYEVLVSVWRRGCVKWKGNTDKKKVHLNYGAGKDLAMFSFSKRFYDLILAYSQRNCDYYSLYTQCQVVGNPKFDDWFNGEFDNEFLANIRSKIDSNKKIILYLPTHSDLCSIDDLAAQLKKISKKYNLIVKLHYYTVFEEQKRVEKLKHRKIILLKDEVDLLPLLKIADVVISDNSSAIFDAILADKPLVVTDFLSKEYLNVKHQTPKHYRIPRSFALTYSGSIEQKIKKEGLVLTIKKPEELERMVEQALKDELYFQESRKKIKEELFAFNDGKCGERAAQAIKELLLTKQLPEKPLFYWLADAFEKEIKNFSFLKQKKDLEKFQKRKKSLFLKKIKKDNREKIIFSIIVINSKEKDSENFLKVCIHSLFRQNFPSQNFEIILTNIDSKEKHEKIIAEIASQHEDKKQKPIVKYVENKNSPASLEFIKNALDQAQGEIICFTKSNYFLPPDWLLNFYLLYQEHPEACGIGGFTIKFPTIKNIFDEYYHLELARKLGINKEDRYFEKAYTFKNRLFYQNPAGMIANISYQKEVLMALSLDFQKSSLEIFEADLKQKFLASYDLWFIPSLAYDIEKMTFEKFIKKNFQEGIAFSFIISVRPELKKYYKYTIFSLLKLPFINLLDDYSKIKLLPIIFIGTLYRLLGKWYFQLSK